MTSKSEYRNSWIAEKLDRINLTVPKGRKMERDNGVSAASEEHL